MASKEIDDSLHLDLPWSMGESGFKAVTGVLRRLPALKRLLEFGSGRSTVRLALAFPEISIVSYEHDSGYLRFAEDLARRHGVSSRIDFHYAPVRLRMIHGACYWTYGTFRLAGDFDAVIIDGPPGFFLEGREACLYAAYPRLRTGGVVILDDYRRKAERRAVRNWMATYSPSLRLERMDVGHGLAVMVKESSVSPHWMTMRLADGFARALRRISPKTAETEAGG